MEEQILIGLVGTLSVMTIYFWWVRKPTPATAEAR